MPNVREANTLTDKQAAFVSAYIAANGNGAEAARQAGYPAESAAAMAHKNLKLPKVLEEIQRHVGQALALSTVKAANRIGDLVDNSRSDFVKLQAAQDILDRTGFKQQEQQVSGEVHVHIDLG